MCYCTPCFWTHASTSLLLAVYQGILGNYKCYNVTINVIVVLLHFLEQKNNQLLIFSCLLGDFILGSCVTCIVL